MSKDKVVIMRGFEFDPIDLAVAFNHVAKEMFGPDPFIGTKSRFWLSKNPVAFSTVKVGVNQEAKVALGEMEIRGIKGEWVLEGSGIQAFVSESETTKVESFLDKIKARLKTSSIYKSKAMTSSREFMDLIKIDPATLVYNQQVLDELTDNLLVLFEKTDDCRRAGVQIRRRVLFQGKFGAGKTMGALMMAKKATENGFTVFYLEPNIKNSAESFEFMLQISGKYPPAVLIVEEFDQEQRLGNPYVVSSIMASIDGMLSKNSEVILILTTNFKDRIAGGLQRPGRIDKIINFNIFSSEDSEKLLKLVIPPEYLNSDINWQRVGSATSHLAPAFIKEIGTGATLAAISRAKNGDKPIVTEEILLRIAEGLQDQHKACEAAEQMGFNTQK